MRPPHSGAEAEPRPDGAGGSEGAVATNVAKGAIAGAAGWLVMDRVLRAAYDREAPGVRRREDEARGGVPALEVVAETLAGLVGVSLSAGKRRRAGKALQWVMGIGAGAAYGGVRSRLPGSGVRRGLLYGAAFSLVVDEGLTPLLGFAPGPSAFPWQNHARCVVGHLAYGAATEVAFAALDGATRASGRRRTGRTRPRSGSSRAAG